MLRAAAEQVGRRAEVGEGLPALLIPGIVPLDEPLGALQLGMQAVLLPPVPGHALGGDAETGQDGVEG